MAVIRKASALWLFWAAVATVCAAEEAEGSFEAEALAQAERDFLAAVAELGDAIASCSRKVSQGRVPMLDAQKLTQLNAEREDAVIGLAHLSAQNMFECERDARLVTAYYAGSAPPARGFRQGH